jgi:glycosyltransferase involved in cell wall biosynthesis
MKPMSEVLQTASKTALDRSRWHKPLVSVIVTHRNYSEHVRDALLSVLDQTHDNWECVVVDDASEPPHLAALKRVVEDIGSPRIGLVELPANVGQVPAAFAGLDNTSGEFVCILDPDDRYAETFLEEAVAGHLNETVYCPILSTGQFFVSDGSVITGTVTRHRLHFMGNERGVNVIPEQPKALLLYYPPGWGGWHWGSTSSIMFRRAAVELMRPSAPPKWRKELDSYLAQGAHLLGGTLCLTKPLVYRTLHADNSYLLDRIISLANIEGKFNGVDRARMRLQDALAAIKANGGGALLYQPDPTAKRRRRGLFARLGRSIAKRWRRWRAR